MTFPTLKSLTAAFPHLSQQQLADARYYGVAPRSILLSHPAGAKREAECYNPPATSDIRLTVLNAIMGTHGVECCYAKGQEAHGTEAPAMEYLNTGDSYEATIIRFRGGRYAIGSWGDWAERNA
jgi:hypothetical protein